ncbi:MAG: divalent-cation tolerance protein CutA [Xanthomonadales bacterium]|nr:divalent-cation tolerance protein CutA [Xanthomonadales bacterium]ODU92656.1 MAG: hypothetical protein ABT18_11630 [Rhodanobacter sp. SCN 66-43]OJY85401.1 MAG: divalent-cation tolerance protein CutA [Xanthomonadales bacterium 66-474]
MSTPLLCLSTCPDADTAARIARTLVEERLAACVNRLPGVVSTYRWQGGIHEDAEVLLVIKTTRGCFATLRDRLVALHPYEVPELVALEIAEGLPAYLDWLARETEAVGGGTNEGLRK